MPYDVRPDYARELIVATVTGRFVAPEIVAMVTAARELSHDRGWNILYDMREGIPGEVGSGELFWMPRSLPALREAIAKRVRVALLHPAAYAHVASFWETTFRNAGLQARAFVAEDDAVRWLRAQSDDPPAGEP